MTKKEQLDRDLATMLTRHLTAAEDALKNTVSPGPDGVIHATVVSTWAQVAQAHATMALTYATLIGRSQ